MTFRDHKIERRVMGVALRTPHSFQVSCQIQESLLVCCFY
jgi:hypothetical protein